MIIPDKVVRNAAHRVADDGRPDGLQVWRRDWLIVPVARIAPAADRRAEAVERVAHVGPAGKVRYLDVLVQRCVTIHR